MTPDWKGNIYPKFKHQKSHQSLERCEVATFQHVAHRSLGAEDGLYAGQLTVPPGAHVLDKSPGELLILPAHLLGAQ